MNKKLMAAVFFILFMVSAGADAELTKDALKVSDRPNPEAGPTKVETKIWVLDISSINSANQTFNANIFIGITWKDPRLTHSSSGSVKYPLDKIWNPALQITNESRLVRKTFPEVAIIQPDGTVEYRQRYVGTFLQPLRLDDFPSDQHKFRIHFISPSYTPEIIQFVPDKKWVNKGVPYAAGISKDISLPDWEILDYIAEESPYLITENYENAGYAFVFTAKRLVKYYYMKVIMPLVFIVMMSWVVFWIDPENSSTQIAASITSMLTLIAYRFAIDTQVPKISYTTRMDEFIFMSTLLVFIVLVQVILTSTLAQHNKVSTARKIDKMSRIVFPTVFFASVFLTLFR
jgi:hypothetical protein